MPPNADEKKKDEKKAADEMEMRQSAVIAATLANVELQTTKQTLQQFVQMYNQAREENSRLVTELAEREQDSMTVVQFLRKELEKKADVLKEKNRSFEAAKEAMQKEFQEEKKLLSDQIEEKDREIDELRQLAERQQADLDALDAFQRERQNMHLEFSQFRDQQKAEALRYEAEISGLRFQSLEEKVKLKAEERSLTERFEEEVNARAMKLLEPKTREIHKDNYFLMQDKILLEREIAKLTSENKELTEKYGVLRRNSELAQSAEGIYSTRNAKLSRENRLTTEKMKTLERTLKDVVEQYEGKLEIESTKAQRQIEALKTDRDEANRNAEAKHRELCKMRRMARDLVTQRTDLETFFNEALEYVRGEVSRERVELLKQRLAPQITQGPSAAAAVQKSSSQRGRGGGGGSRPVPGRPHDKHAFFLGDFESIDASPLGDGGAAHPLSANSARVDAERSSLHEEVQPPPPGSAIPVPIPRVDVSQLPWKDKERVLRILFAKINAMNSRPQPSAAPPPPPMELSLPPIAERAHKGPSAFVTQPL